VRTRKASRTRRKERLTLGALVAAAGVAAAVALADRGRHAPPAKAQARTPGARSAEAPLGSHARQPLPYYTGSIRADLFAAGEPAAAAVSAPAPPPAVPAPPPPAPEPDPLADYAYTGTVEADGQIMALVENKKTLDGQYLKVGDSIQGRTVSAITERTLTLGGPGSERVLAKTDSYALVSLDKSAPYMTAQPQQGQPGQPGAPGQPGGPGPGGPGGFGGFGGRRGMRFGPGGPGGGTGGFRGFGGFGGPGGAGAPGAGLAEPAPAQILVAPAPAVEGYAIEVTR